jgi:hypothetical protein
LVPWLTLHQEIEAEARSALVERWSRLNDYGRYLLVVELAEFLILGAGPSSWLMLRASFREIWEAMCRGAAAIRHGLTGGWQWGVGGLVSFFLIAWLVMEAFGRPEWYNELDEWYKGHAGSMFLVAFFGAFCVGAAAVIIPWFKPLSQEDATQEA